MENIWKVDFQQRKIIEVISFLINETDMINSFFSLLACMEILHLDMSLDICLSITKLLMDNERYRRIDFLFSKD